MVRQTNIFSQDWTGLAEPPDVKAAQKPVAIHNRIELPTREYSWRVFNISSLLQISILLFAIIFTGSSHSWEYGIGVFAIGISLYGLSALTINYLRRRKGHNNAVVISPEGIFAPNWSDAATPWSAVGEVSWHGPRWLGQLHVQLDPDHVTPHHTPFTNKWLGTSDEATSMLLLSNWGISGIDDDLATKIEKYRDNYC